MLSAGGGVRFGRSSLLCDHRRVTHVPLLTGLADGTPARRRSTDWTGRGSHLGPTLSANLLNAPGADQSSMGRWIFGAATPDRSPVAAAAAAPSTSSPVPSRVESTTALPPVITRPFR